MKNILNKLYVSKEDKGTQVDINLLLNDADLGNS